MVFLPSHWHIELIPMHDFPVFEFMHDKFLVCVYTSVESIVNTFDSEKVVQNRYYVKLFYNKLESIYFIILTETYVDSVSFTEKYVCMWMFHVAEFDS